MRAFSDVTELLQAYFDGFYHGDVEQLKTVFHPACHLYSAAEGAVVDDDMETVYARVRDREAPAVRDEVRADRVLSIHLSDAITGLATVEIGIGDKLFTDYLNVVHVDGRWQIIAKVFTFVPRNAETRAAAAD